MYFQTELKLTERFVINFFFLRHKLFFSPQPHYNKVLNQSLTFTSTGTYFPKMKIALLLSLKNNCPDYLKLDITKIS